MTDPADHTPDCAACQFLDAYGVRAAEQLTNGQGQKWWACSWHARIARGGLYD